MFILAYSEIYKRVFGNTYTSIRQYLNEYSLILQTSIRQYHEQLYETSLNQSGQLFFSKQENMKTSVIHH